MTSVGNINAGSRLTAAMLQGVAPLAAWKTADQFVVSNATTYTADSQLYIPNLAANAVYVLAGQVLYEGGTANSSDYDWQFSGSGITWNLTVIQMSRAATPAINMLHTTTTGGNGTNGAGVTLSMTLNGLVYTTTANQTLQFAFKQHTSSATNTYTHIGSYLSMWQVQ